MKYSKVLNLSVVVLALSLGAAGCQPRPHAPTPILGRTGNPKGTGETFGRETPVTQLPPDQNPTVRGDIPLQGRFNPDEMTPDHNRFAANTVYFDFDRATVKPSETGKIDEVVRYLQGNPTQAVQIEGHCDERGTEQYNLSLGERRALAVREYLVTAGVQAERAFTISYGESRPAVPGHNEATWSKNRRGVFVLLTPK